MERLLADASKIAGVEFNIDSYADVIQAIHVMQESMEIAGTTSVEAAGTVSGSISMLQASWQNMLTAIGTGEDIEETAQQLTDSFITVLSNVIPLAGQVMAGMGQALLIGLGNALTGAINYVAGWYGQFESAAANMVQGLVNGIAAGRDAVINKIREICSSALEAVKSFFGIHSPSTVFEWIGEQTDEGWAIGLDKKKNRVIGAMRSISGSVLASAYSGTVASGTSSASGSATNIYINGARVNDTDGINAAVGDFLLYLQRKAVL